MNHMTRWIVLATAALLLLGRAHGQDEARYYIMQLSGQKAGWMSETVTTGEGLITTAAEMEFTIKRGPIEISITVETEFVETDTHEPVSMRSKQAMGAMPIETVYTFLPDGVEVAITQNGATTTTTQARPEGEWLTPAKASALMAEALLAGETEVTVITLDPTLGLTPVTSTRSRMAEASIEVLGKVVPGYEATTTTSAAPGTESSEFLDRAGKLLRSTTTLGGMEITTIAADRELALAEADPPEIMRSTFIKPDRVIRTPRRTTGATYLIAATTGTLEDLPETSSQRVERVDEATLRVTVTSDAFSDVGGAPTDADLGSSTMITCTDEAIVALLERSGTRRDAPASVRAEGLRRFVHGYIDEKTLGVGFASASEVARTRVGDCSEHAALLAAVLRADGIPARVASGLVYARDFIGSEDIFGYHMWTRAYIDTPEGPRWVDLDATLPGGVAYDATHITLDESTLSDGETINAMIALAPLMGRLEISIESAE